MKIAIIGPGALGCLLAASLTIKLDRSNKKIPALDLWLLDHLPDRAKKLNEQGLILEEGGQQKHCKIKATADPNAIGSADIIILCVKSLQVAAGLDLASQLVHEDTLLLTMQNGIGHLELLKDKQKPPSIVIGVTAQGANLVAPGHVRHAGDGLTRVGFLKSVSFSKSLLLAKMCNMLNYGGIETVIVDNIMDYVWSKLLINAGINALTAIHRYPNGKLLESADIKDRLTAAVSEGAAVARTLGINLIGDPLAMTLAVCSKTAQNLSSMLQDVNNGRPTEIDSINGAIAAAGRKLDIPTPVNDALVHEIKEIEQSY
ncbi:MAG: 2-dehydropantoate 2-reductase [Deltaproteobacteria bacterium]|jgi:2-dehydropantoate 2-reductase|nr:2-dehydropantoate 2-reductase [Deltaproteobacteria bacterium]